MPAAVRRDVVCALTLLTGAGLAGPAAAQTGEQFPYVAALTEDGFVRAGADSRYYPFGRVLTGDVIKVIGEKNGWARVATLGPAFAEFFGYVKYPKTETGHFRLSPDGTAGTTTGPTDVFAPNLDARFDPRSSWKPAVTLPAKRTLKVLETVAYEGDLVNKVVLPGDAEGWIDLVHLRPATPAENVAWEAAVASAPAAAPPEGARAAAPQPAPIPIPEPQLGPVQPNEGAAIDTAPPPVVSPSEQTVQAPTPVPALPLPRRSPEFRLAQIMLEDLEAAYARLLTEPTETAEVVPLRGLYLDLAKRHPDSRTISQYARTRALQLDLWAEVQQRRLELADLQARARQTSSDTEAARQTLESAEGYVAVGRLEASIIYDGKNLPKLLRVRETTTGRTVGYLQPTDQFDFASMLGRRIGVVGDRDYDGALRLNLVQPRRIDVLEE